MFLKLRAGMLLLFGISGGATLAQSASSPQSIQVADIQRRLSELEQQDSRLHEEISALQAMLQTRKDEPDAATLVLASSIRPTSNMFSASHENPVSSSSQFAAASTAVQASAGIHPAILNFQPSPQNPLAGAVPIGMLDVYYSYNEHQPVSGVSTMRLFDDQTNQFALNLLEFGLTRQPTEESRFGYTFTIGFGDSINAVNSTDPEGLNFAHYLHEGYGSYLVPVAHGLKTDAGKFDTPIGAESMESLSDWNYSRSLLYNYAVPFYAFGVRSQYVVNDKYAVTGYLVNGWNNITDTYSSGKTGGFVFAWRPVKRFSVSEGFLSGRGATDEDKEIRTITDTVIRYDATAKLSLMTDTVYGHSEQLTGYNHPVFWTGTAGYLQYRFSPLWTASTRFEYYDDHNGASICGTCATPVPQDLKEVTLTGSRTVAQHLLGRFEYRYDMSNKPVFYRAGTPIKDQVTLTLGFVYDLQPIGGKKE